MNVSKKPKVDNAPAAKWGSKGNAIRQAAKASGLSESAIRKLARINALVIRSPPRACSAACLRSAAPLMTY